MMVPGHNLDVINPDWIIGLGPAFVTGARRAR
jgi:excinuclease UvrABC ATPase subunit